MALQVPRENPFDVRGKTQSNMYITNWCCHLQCGLLSIPVLALEADVLPTVAVGLHRAGAFWGGWM